MEQQQNTKTLVLPISQVLIISLITDILTKLCLQMNACKLDERTVNGIELYYPQQQDKLKQLKILAGAVLE
jgi:hypothetical protein